MDDHRNVSVSRVYVPNEYTIYLAPGDREQFESYEDQLKGELAEYLSEHARRENYVLLTPPRVHLVRPSIAIPCSSSRFSQSGNSSAEIANAIWSGPWPSCGGIVPPGMRTGFTRATCASSCFTCSPM